MFGDMIDCSNIIFSVADRDCCLITRISCLFREMLLVNLVIWERTKRREARRMNEKRSLHWPSNRNHQNQPSSYISVSQWLSADAC